MKNYSLFNRISNSISDKFKQEIIIENIQVKLQCTSRNSLFQRKIIQEIDTLIHNELETVGISRKFSKKIIEEKLKEQKNICTICNSIIKPNENYEGDHIIPWTAGGKTIIENLQVLHKRCHQLKSC